VNIIQKLIPTKYKRIRPGAKRTPTYITIHETDNTSRGADASAHARLLYSGNGERVASWHYTVDEKSVYQSIPDNEVAWACGDGANGTGNKYSISIEICVNSDGNFTKAKQNAAELVRYLMNKHNIPISRVVQHNRWSGKNCPRRIRSEGWSKFIELVKGTSVKPQPYDKNPEYHRLLAVETPYMRGEDVKRVQVRLKTKLIDGIYGPMTEADVKMWQRVHDEKGNVVPAGKGLVVDGIVGPKTWNALFGA
jgi:N-acetylmuramoyl-L-alanine amidase